VKTQKQVCQDIIDELDDLKQVNEYHMKTLQKLIDYARKGVLAPWQYKNVAYHARSLKRNLDRIAHLEQN
jgi:hypothetical protein